LTPRRTNRFDSAGPTPAASERTVFRRQGPTTPGGLTVASPYESLETDPAEESQRFRHAPSSHRFRSGKTIIHNAHHPHSGWRGNQPAGFAPLPIAQGLHRLRTLRPTPVQAGSHRLRADKWCEAVNGCPPGYPRF